MMNSSKWPEFYCSGTLGNIFARTHIAQQWPLRPGRIRTWSADALLALLSFECVLHCIDSIVTRGDE
jgi:hypothetical protein